MAYYVADNFVWFVLGEKMRSIYFVFMAIMAIALIAFITLAEQSTSHEQTSNLDMSWRLSIVPTDDNRHACRTMRRLPGNEETYVSVTAYHADGDGEAGFMGVLYAVGLHGAKFRSGLPEDTVGVYDLNVMAYGKVFGDAGEYVTGGAIEVDDTEDDKPLVFYISDEAEYNPLISAEYLVVTFNEGKSNFKIELGDSSQVVESQVIDIGRCLLGSEF
jgi:hypothetical protein